jgi:hypothetical protein
MNKRLTILFLAVLAFPLATSVRAGAGSWSDDAGDMHFSDEGKAPSQTQQQELTGSSVVAGNRGASASQIEIDRLKEEVGKLQEGLISKRTEAAKLHRKWVVAKGRLPSKGELAEFEKKRAQGEVPIADNPFVNKSPLSSPGMYRKAYFLKVEEIKHDEEHVVLLQDKINALSHR